MTSNPYLITLEEFPGFESNIVNPEIREIAFDICVKEDVYHCNPLQRIEGINQSQAMISGPSVVWALQA